MLKYVRWSARLLGLVPACLAAQGGRTALPLLQLPASARALALGGSAVLLQGDDAALFFNPAQLLSAGRVRARVGAGGSFQSWLASSSLSALSAVLPVAGGALGVGVQALDYGSGEGIDPDPSTGGETGISTGQRVTATEIAGSLGYAHPLGPVQAGGAVKVVRQRLADESAGGAALDVGASTRWHGAAIAASMQNLGASMRMSGRGAAMPALVRLGVATPPVRREALGLVALGEVARVRDLPLVPIGALEGRWIAANGIRVFLRVGVRRDPADDLASPASVGAGFATRHLAVDYAYRGLGEIGQATHRIGLRWWR